MAPCSVATSVLPFKTFYPLEVDERGIRYVAWLHHGMWSM